MLSFFVSHFHYYFNKIWDTSLVPYEVCSGYTGCCYFKRENFRKLGIRPISYTTVPSNLFLVRARAG